MKDKAKIIGIILGVILFIALMGGITYAVFYWASDPTGGYVDVTSECFIIDYTKGEDILDGKLNISYTYKYGLSAAVKAKLSDRCPTIEEGIATIYIDTKDETSDYLITNNLLSYTVFEDGAEVSTGKIANKGLTAVYENASITDTEKEFTVYLWINMKDVTDDNLDGILASTYSGGINMSAEGR